MKLVVSLDVEADNQWDHGSPLATRNVSSWLPFQDLCERHGVIPTYLLTTEIVEDERARALLTDWQRRGAAEVGAHLHPWTTPPFVDMPGLRFNDVLHAFPSQIPSELLRDKVNILTRQITEAFGQAPTAFRAGRFGFDARLARYLAEAGFVVDSSVTPLTSWRRTKGLGGNGGPDFSHQTVEPFRIEGSGNPGLLELPVTVVATYSLLQRSRTLLNLYKTLPARALRKLVLSKWFQPQPMWLNPRPHYGPGDLVRVWRSADQIGVDVAVMMFHSSELMAGGSPYRPTADSIRDLYVCLDRFFSFVRDSGGEFAGLTDAANALTIRRPIDVRPL